MKDATYALGVETMRAEVLKLLVAMQAAESGRSPFWVAVARAVQALSVPRKP